MTKPLENPPFNETDSQRLARELQAENDRLRKERRFYDNLIAMQQGIVLLLDPRGRIVLVNPFFEKLTGYRSDQLVGLDWFDTFIPQAERGVIRDLFDVVMRDGVDQGHANPILTSNGGPRLIQWQSKTLEDDDGKITGLLSSGYDITDMEAAADALREARDAADRATTAKSRFLAAASHDLRQPLQSLGIYLSVLSRELTDGRTRDIAGKMRQSLDTMGELLDALLDISKLDSGTVAANMQSFPLQDILDQVAADSTPHAEDKGLLLRIAPTQLVVNSDPALLQRIIENFVTNAIRYTKEGEIRVVCRAVGQMARIEVTDTGVGIPAESLETVFEEYFQLENPVRNRSKGLGLGLSIVRHIAQLLEHEVSVESTPGEGSTFAVTTPLVGSAAERKPSATGACGSRKTALSGKVLLIDDDPAVIDATRVLLEIEGFDVQTAIDGDQALEYVADGLRPKVIVTDYRLPGLNGVEVVRRIRELAAERVPAIVVTGDTSGQEILAANLNNCSILHKPADADKLISLINESRS